MATTIRDLRRASRAFLLGACCFLSFSVGAEDAARLQPTRIAAGVVDDVVLVKFSPDSKNLAYATRVARFGKEMLITEVKRIPMSGGKPFLMLPTSETEEYGLDWGAHTTQLEWIADSHLVAKVYNGDDGSRDYVLDASRTGSLRHQDFWDGDDDPAPTVDSAVRALVPAWNPQALLGAMHYKVDFPGHGILAQKHYAGEDDNIWWLDPQIGKPNVILEQKESQTLELMAGFAFGDRVLFAVREGSIVRVYLLDAEGGLQDIPALQTEARTTAERDRYKDVIQSNVAGLESRACSPEACWALFWTDFDDTLVAKVIRMTAEGDVEVLDALPGLKDFDISPNHQLLAAIIQRGGKGRLSGYRILRF